MFDNEVLGLGYNSDTHPRVVEFHQRVKEYFIKFMKKREEWKGYQSDY